MTIDQDVVKGQAMGLWAKVKAAYAYNPFTVKRDTPITCPKCHTENLAIAVSCKECGEQFAYKPMKRGVILGIGLTASILLVISTWLLCAATGLGAALGAEGAAEANSLANLLWFAAVAGIVATVASYKMKHWGWKLQSIVCAIYILSGLGEIITTLFLISPLIVSAWLGYKSMREAGEYLDKLHQSPASSK